MAADTTILQGEVIENPKEQKLNVEALLASLLKSLIIEQSGQGEQTPEGEAQS
jgi:hypothetical protein